MTTIISKTISNQVLDKAMRLFWEKGYFNTSVDELIAVTGFNRRAIYHFFGGKRDLFLALLMRYRAEVTDKLTAPLQNYSDGLKAIETFFHQFLHLRDSDNPCGCFLIATASDMPSHDQEVAQVIERFSAELNEYFQACLTQAFSNTESCEKPDIKGIADFLVVNVFGLMTMDRAQVDQEVIRTHVEMVTQFLNLQKYRN
ncbi:TetR/AcrR family transcriptional regulator [Legionella yabuuchiae]|uniref:TetR/AcrR family transcriptional regulator n=1 Tax=Legionella yabuuchiae TaxID=376727 RepID=UPI001054EE4F|nr:TetR/AcrR family transcriptional regulator [Legionella yabuuchiae]